MTTLTTRFTAQQLAHNEMAHFMSEAGCFGNREEYQKFCDLALSEQRQVVRRIALDRIKESQRGGNPFPLREAALEQMGYRRMMETARLLDTIQTGSALRSMREAGLAEEPEQAPSPEQVRMRESSTQALADAGVPIKGQRTPAVASPGFASAEPGSFLDKLREAAPKPCPDCPGDGVDRNAEGGICATCDGRGFIPKRKPQPMDDATGRKLQVDEPAATEAETREAEVLRARLDRLEMLVG